MADMASIATITFQGVDATSGVATGVSNAITSVEGAATRAGGALVSMAAGAAKLAVAVGAISFTAVAAGITTSVTAAAGFEKQMSAVTAVMDQAQLAAAGGGKALADLALQLGKDTSFSAQEAAQGLEELAKAGVSVQDIMSGGAKAALDLAAAGGISVADAAGIASNAMATFNKSGSEMAGIADTISGAANASAIDVHQFGLSLSAVGAVAQTVGISFEDTATAIAVLGQNGLKGSDAGTSLKTMLLNLSPATKQAKEEMMALGIITADGSNRFFDAQGKAKGLADISQILQEATANLTQEQKLNALQTIFGTDAIRAAAIMSNNGATGFNNMADAMKASGGASAVADARLNNLAGSMEKLKGSIETASITFGQHLLPSLKKVADAATDMVNRAIPGLDKLGESAAGMLDRFIDKAAAAIPAIMTVGSSILSVAQKALPVFVTAAGRAAVAGEQMVAKLLGLSIADYANEWDLLGGIITRSGELIITGVQGIVSAVQTGWPVLVSAFETVEPIAVRIGKAFIDNIATQITFITSSVIPPLVSIVQQTASVFESTLLPAAQKTGEVFRGVLGDSLAWLAATAWPPLMAIVQQAAAFWTGTLLPAIPPLAAALRTALGESLQWLATTGFPALLSAATVAVNFLSSTVVPAIVPVAAAIRTGLGVAIQWVAQTGWPMFLTAATAVSSFITGTVIPAVQTLATWLQTNLPPAINSILTVWQTVQGKLAPIVQALFSGDIKTAISGLGTAFSEFATLAIGWLGEQVAAIDWASVWQQAVDVAVALGTYVAGLTVDFVTWLGAQVAAIDWAGVWTKTVTVATALGTYLAGLAVDFATWLGTQIAAIDWAALWAKTVTVATALGTYVAGLTVDFATWLGAQIALVDWAALWQQTVTVASALGSYLLTLAVDFATWLGAEVAKIPWPDVWAKVVGLTEAAATAIGVQLAAIDWAGVFEAILDFDTKFYTWITEQIKAVDWAGLGTTTGDMFGNMLTGAGNGAAGVDWAKIGADTAKALGAALGAAVTAKEAWDAFAKGMQDGFTKSITGITVTDAQSALGNKLLDMLKGAWDDATGGWHPTLPNIFGGGTSSAPAGATQMSNRTGAPSAATGQKPGPSATPASYTADWEKEAYQAAVKAGIDPVRFVEQIREESSGNPNAYNAKSGATGIAQLIPKYHPNVDPTDPHASLTYAANLQAQAMQQYGDPSVALASYNAGPGNVAKYGGVPPFEETQRYVTEIEQRRQAVLAQQQQQAAQAVQTAGGVQGPPAAGGFQGQLQKIGNQFELGLPWEAALAACGPAALALFYEATGRTPNESEVVRIAAQNGWTPGGGMTTGPAGFMKSLGELGIQYANLPATAQSAQQSVQGGNLTAISTGGGNVPLSSGHYFVAQGFNPATGQFDLGETGGPDPNNPSAGHALKGGSRFMTAEEITALAGPINGVIQLVNQLPPAADAAGVAFDGTTASLKQFGDTSTTAAPQFAGMTQDVITSVDAAGSRITTFSTDTLGSFITTTTDTTGQVIGLWGELSNGVQLNMADTAAGVTTTSQTMNGQLITTTQDTAGNMITTVTDANGQIVAQWSALAGQVTTTNATMGNQLILDSAAAATGRNLIIATAAQTEVTTAQTTATEVVQANTDMNTQSVGQVQGMSGAILQSVTDMGNGVTMTVTTTANGTVTTLQDWSGKVIGVYTETESQTSTSVDTMATNTEDAAGRVIDVSGTVGSALGDMGQAFKDTGAAAKDAAPPVKDYGTAAASVKPINMGDSVKNLQAVSKAAQEAKKSLDELQKTNTGGGKQIKNIAGNQSGSDIAGTTGMASAQDAVAGVMSTIADLVTEVIGGSTSFLEQPTASNQHPPQGVTGGGQVHAIEPAPPATAPTTTPISHGPAEPLPGQTPNIAPSPARPVLYAPTLPDISEFDKQLAALGDGADTETQRMSIQLQKNFAVMVKNMTAQGILVDRNVTNSTEDMSGDVISSGRDMQTHTVDAATDMQTGVSRAAAGMQTAAVDSSVTMAGTIVDRVARMADGTIAAAGTMRDQVSTHADGMRGSVVFAADQMRGSAIFQTQQMRDGMAVAAGEARDSAVLAVQAIQTLVPAAVAAAIAPTNAQADALKRDFVQRFIDSRDGANTAIGQLRDPSTGLPKTLSDVSGTVNGSNGPAEKLGNETVAAIVKGIHEDSGKIGTEINAAIKNALQNATVPRTAGVASAPFVGDPTSAIDLAMPTMIGTAQLGNVDRVIADFDYDRLAKAINTGQRDVFSYTVYSQATTSTAVQDVETLRTLAQTR